MLFSNKSKFRIILDKTQYFPGELLSGKISFTPDKEASIEDIEFSFNLLENWFYSYDKKTENINYQITKFDLNLKKFFLENNSKYVHLFRKQYNYPFKYKLPDYLNPSFEYPSEKYRVYIRYSLNAKVKSDIYTGETSLYVEIKGIPNNNKNSKVEATSLPIKRGSIFDIGNIILNASCDSKIFRFTSPIPVNINIDNTKSKVKATEFKIYLIIKIILINQINLKNKYNK